MFNFWCLPFCAVCCWIVMEGTIAVLDLLCHGLNNERGYGESISERTDSSRD